MDDPTTPYELPATPTVAWHTGMRQAAKEGDRRAKATLTALAARQTAESATRQAATTRRDGTVADAAAAARKRREAGDARRAAYRNG